MVHEQVFVHISSVFPANDHSTIALYTSISSPSEVGSSPDQTGSALSQIGDLTSDSAFCWLQCKDY
jgi:hypothetical protein